MDAETPPPPQTASSRLANALFGRVDGASLAAFRFAFGVTVLWEMWRHFQYDWIRHYYVDPTFWFSYPGFSWVTPWPGNWMYLHYAVTAAAAACVALGYRYRVSSLVTALGFTYIFLLDQSHYLNHFYLVSLLSWVMATLPCHRTLSMDAAAGRVEASDTAPRWALWTARFMVGVPYFFGGVAKLNHDWLSGAPIREWLARVVDFPLIGHLFTEEWAVQGFVWGGLLLDLLIVPALLYRPTRKYAYFAAVCFHVTNARLFLIGIFPWFMIAATTIFFEPSWPRLGGHLIPKVGRGNEASTAWTLPRAAGMATLALFALAQCALPLRHHLYDGHVSWTEEGHRFSWHMKLRAKAGEASFIAYSPELDTEWTINPRLHLTARQARKMSGHPMMVRQFARFLADDLREDGLEGVQIRVVNKASLNGRPPQTLIRPDIDLAASDAEIEAQDWLAPLTTPLPSRADRTAKAARIAERVASTIYQ